MASQAYQTILKQAQTELSSEEQAALAAALASGVGSQPEKKKRSLLELEGLGKEIWKGIDAAEYVAKERDSWDR